MRDAGGLLLVDAVPAAGKIKLAQAYWDPGAISVPAGMQMFAPNIDEAYEKQ